MFSMKLFMKFKFWHMYSIATNENMILSLFNNVFEK